MPDSLAVPPVSPPRPRRRLVRRRFLLLLLLCIPLLLVLWPKSFHWFVRHGLIWEARQQGIKLSIGRLYGSCFEPLSFRRVQLETTSRQGVQTSARIQRADASFSARRLLFHRGQGWLRNLQLDGVNADFRVLPEHAEEAPDRPGTVAAELPLLGLLAPAQVQARRTNLRFILSGDAIVFNGVRLYFNHLAPGGFVARQVIVDNERLSKIFRNVRGAATWQDEFLTLINVKMDDDLLLTSSSLDLGAFMRGKMLVKFAADAFGGKVNGELRDTGSGQLNFQATGNFLNIQVDRLARFSSYAEPAAGVIDDGTFTFRGSPRSPEKATMTVHLSSKDFRWGERRWDSFVFGATFLHRRLQIPELELRQAQNTLSVRGEMTLPGDATPWWKKEFDFEVAARLNDLSQFSALGGDRFSGLSGKLTVDGSIRGENQFYSGQMIASGSKMAYRGAPIDSLEAAVKVHGNEVQITNLELLHKDDFARGKGVVSILGSQQYSGEFKAAVADLSVYAALLQPPLAPHPFGGSVKLNWSGDGSPSVHSGAFSASFKQLRSLTKSEASFPALNADLEGTYAPGNVFLSRCAVSDADTQFSATVTVSPAALRLQTMRLEHAGKVSLEGDALLPINLWSAWPHPQIDADGHAEVKLRARNLELADALLLAGKVAPFDAQIDLEATGTGPLSSVAFSGKVRAKSIAIMATSEVRTDVSVDLQVAGNFRAAAITGGASLNRMDMNAMIDLESVLAPIHIAPNLQFFTNEAPYRDWTLQVVCLAEKPLNLAEGDATFTPSLQLSGTLGAPVLAGAAQFTNLVAAGPHASLTLTRGALIYGPGLPDSPSIQAEGSGLVSGRKFGVTLSGAFAKPAITLVDENGQPDETLRDRIQNGEPAPTPNPIFTPAPLPTPSASLTPLQPQ